MKVITFTTHCDLTNGFVDEPLSIICNEYELLESDNKIENMDLKLASELPVILFERKAIIDYLLSNQDAIFVTHDYKDANNKLLLDFLTTDKEVLSYLSRKGYTKNPLRQFKFKGKLLQAFPFKFENLASYQDLASSISNLIRKNNLLSDFEELRRVGGNRANKRILTDLLTQRLEVIDRFLMDNLSELFVKINLCRKLSRNDEELFEKLMKRSIVYLVSQLINKEEYYDFDKKRVINLYKSLRSSSLRYNPSVIAEKFYFVTDQSQQREQYTEYHSIKNKYNHANISITPHVVHYHKKINTFNLNYENGHSVIQIDFKSFYPTLLVNFNLIGEQSLERYKNYYEKKFNETTPTKKAMYKTILNSYIGNMVHCGLKEEHDLLTTLSKLIMLHLILELQSFTTIISVVVDSVTVVVEKDKLQQLQEVLKAFSQLYHAPLDVEQYNHALVTGLHDYIFVGETLKTRGKYNLNARSTRVPQIVINLVHDYILKGKNIEENLEEYLKNPKLGDLLYFRHTRTKNFDSWVDYSFKPYNRWAHKLSRDYSYLPVEYTSVREATLSQLANYDLLSRPYDEQTLENLKQFVAPDKIQWEEQSIIFQTNGHCLEGLINPREIPNSPYTKLDKGYYIDHAYTLLEELFEKDMASEYAKELRQKYREKRRESDIKYSGYRWYFYKFVDRQ